MSGTTQRHVEQPSDRFFAARDVLGVVIAAFVSAGAMWLLPATTPPPARHGVGVGLVVLVLLLTTRLASQGRLAVHIVAAVLIGAGAALVSRVLAILVG